METTAPTPWSYLFTNPGLSACMHQAILQLHNFPHVVRRFCATCKTFNDNQRYWYSFVLRDMRFPSLEYQRQVQILPKRVDDANLIAYSGYSILGHDFRANEGVKIIHNRRLANGQLVYENGMVSRRIRAPGVQAWQLCSMSTALNQPVHPTDLVNVLAAVPDSRRTVTIFWPSTDNSRHAIYETLEADLESIQAIRCIDVQGAVYLAVRTFVGRGCCVHIYRLTMRLAERVHTTRAKPIEDDDYSTKLHAFASLDSIAVQFDNALELYDPSRAQTRRVDLPENTKMVKHTEAQFVAALTFHDTTGLAIQMLDTATGTTRAGRGLRDVFPITYFDFTSMEYIPFDNSPLSGQLIVMCYTSCVTFIARGMDLCPLLLHAMHVPQIDIEDLVVTVWQDPSDRTYRHRFYLLEDGDALEEWCVQP